MQFMKANITIIHTLQIYIIFQFTISNNNKINVRKKIYKDIST